VVEAGLVRFGPIRLTATAVGVGGGVILFDPIFRGLAVSLMAGGVLSMLVCPVAARLPCRRKRRVDMAGRML
jgi:multidrug efflux pump subunit AcrB